MPMLLYILSGIRLAANLTFTQCFKFNVTFSNKGYNLQTMQLLLCPRYRSQDAILFEIKYV